MTFWAKLLVVVVFVLSIIFAAMSAAVFGQRENWRGQYAKLQRDSAAEKQTLEKAKADLSAQLSIAQNDLSQKSADLEANKRKLDTMAVEVTSAHNELNAKAVEYAKLSDLAQVQARENSTLAGSVVALNADLQKSTTEADGLRGALAKESKRAGDLQDQNRQLNDKLETAASIFGQGRSRLALPGIFHAPHEMPTLWSADLESALRSR